LSVYIGQLEKQLEQVAKGNRDARGSSSRKAGSKQNGTSRGQSLSKNGERYVLTLKHIRVRIVRNWATGTEIVLNVRPRAKRGKSRLRYKLF